MPEILYQGGATTFATTFYSNKVPSALSFQGKKPLLVLLPRDCSRENEYLHLSLTSLQVWWLKMWKEQLPAPLSSEGHSRAASSPEHWHAVEDNRGKLQLRPELPSLIFSGREDSGSLLGWQNNLSGRGPRKSCTSLKQTLGEIVIPQLNRPITKSLFMCLSLWAPENHLYQNFYCHICPRCSHFAKLSSSMLSSHLR